MSTSTLHSSYCFFFFFFREQQIQTEFYNLTATPERSFIMFYAKDGSTMLDKKKMDEVFRIDSILRPKVEVNDSYSIRICHPLCELNTPLLIFWVGHFFASSALICG